MLLLTLRLVARWFCVSHVPNLKKRGVLLNRQFFRTSYVQKLSAGRAKKERKGQGGQDMDSAPSSLAGSWGVRLAPTGSGSRGERRQEVAELWHVASPRHCHKQPGWNQAAIS